MAKQLDQNINIKSRGKNLQAGRGASDATKTAMTIREAIADGCLTDPDAATDLFAGIFDRLDTVLSALDARITALEKK